MPVTTDRIKSFIQDNFLLGSDSRLSEDDSFLERGVLDSTGILELISFIEQEYGVTLSPGELIPENFDSVRRISSFLESKLAAAAVECQEAIPIQLSNSSVRESPPATVFKVPNSDR